MPGVYTLIIEFMHDYTNSVSRLPNVLPTG